MKFGDKMYLDNKEENEKEMSMEEILASIRKYVTEESDEKSEIVEKGNTFESKKSAFELTDEMSIEKQTNKTPEENNNDDKLEIKNPKEDSKEKEDETNKKEINMSNEKKEPLKENDKSSDSILSENILNSSAETLGKLLNINKPSENTENNELEKNINNDITLNEFMANITRPMLKSWLEQNLPGMVEKIVSREIKIIVEKIK